MTEDRSTARDSYALACEVGAAITSSLVLEDVMAEVARRIALALDVWECDLYEYYADSGTVLASAVWAREMTADDTAWVGTQVAIGERSSYGRVFSGGRTFSAYFEDEECDPVDRELMKTWGEKSVLAVPLVFEDKVIGAVALIEKRGDRRFDDADRELAALLAVPAAAAIHNARMFRRQEEETRQLASLLDSSRALTSTVVLEDVLSLVCRRSAEALACGECAIYEYDPERDAIVYRAFHATSPAPVHEIEIGRVCPLSDYPSDREILRRQEVVEGSLSDETLPGDVRRSMLRYGEKSCLTVPLVFNDEPMGLLVLIETERERHFLPAEVTLARGLGEQAAVALRHARLYRRQEGQNRRLLAMLETSRVLAASLDAGKVLAEIRAEVAGLFGAPAPEVNVSVRAGDGRYYPLDVALDMDEGDAAPELDASAVEIDDLAARALDVPGPIQANGPDGARLVTPLVLDGGVGGFVDIRAASTSFTDEDVDLLRILATQAAAAIVNARLYHTVERQAISDGLTGLYNHRYFYRRLRQEFARAQRYRVPLSLLMIDIDDFKRFNDEYGHPAGDLVLAEVGRIISGQLRKGVDLAARYGGEEFVVLLPNTPGAGAKTVGSRPGRTVAKGAPITAAPSAAHDAGARRVAERIRECIATAELPGMGPGGDAHVTVSVGVAAFSGAVARSDDLVRDADRAMYRAKREGKNRVEVFEG